MPTARPITSWLALTGDLWRSNVCCWIQVVALHRQVYKSIASVCHEKSGMSGLALLTSYDEGKSGSVSSATDCRCTDEESSGQCAPDTKAAE